MASRSLLTHLLSQTISQSSCRISPRFVDLISTQTKRFQSQYTQSSNKIVTIDIDRVDNNTIDDHKINLNPFSKPSDEDQKRFIDELRPPLKRSFNLAAYVNTSETLQELVKLGVSLFDIENTNIEAAKKLVLLDFTTDCAPYIRFLIKHGLKPKNLGHFISEYPSIFQVSMETLNTRIEYLKSKYFTNRQIAHSLNRSSRIICENIKTLDHKLGQLQIEFKLESKLVRSIVSQYPPVISLPEGQYRLTNFTLSQEFGFETHEIHILLESQPKLLDILRPVLIERLDLIHNIIGLSHQDIVKFPKLITGPRFDIRHRSSYLEKLKRNQYNPRLPLYIPPSALYNGTDEEFCSKYAKTNLDDFKLFLRSS